jgi:hypothetical protein
MTKRATTDIAPRGVSAPTRRRGRGLATLVLALAAGLALLPPSTASAAPPAPSPELAAALANARQAGVPAEPIDDLLSRGADAGFTDEQLTTLVRTLAALAADELPAGPVLDRVFQGTAKQVAPDRIVTAALRSSERIRQAGRVVDGVLPASAPGLAKEPARRRLIDQSAFALDRGVSEEALRETLTGFSDGTTPVERWRSAQAPVLAVTSLTAEGVPAPEGLEVVREAWQAGFRGRALEELGLGMAAAIHGGENSERVRRRVIEALRRGIPPGQILRQLRPNGPPPRDGLGPPPGVRPRLGDERGRGPGHDGGAPPDDPGRRGRRGGGQGTGGGTGGGGPRG